MSTPITPLVTTYVQLPSGDPLPVQCPDCGGAVEGHLGSSAGYFTGERQYYSTYRALCPSCKREGFPAFFQGEEHLEWARNEAIRQFLDRDSRPHYEVNGVRYDAS